MSFSEFRKKKWVRFISNKYVLILILFITWMIFFDTNSYLIHRELEGEIDALEDNTEFYQKEIDHDKNYFQNEKLKDRLVKRRNGGK